MKLLMILKEQVMLAILQLVCKITQPMRSLEHNPVMTVYTSKG